MRKLTLIKRICGEQKNWRATLKVTTLGLKPGFNLEKLRIFE